MTWPRERKMAERRRNVTRDIEKRDGRGGREASELLADA